MPDAITAEVVWRLALKRSTREKRTASDIIGKAAQEEEEEEEVFPQGQGRHMGGV